MPTALFLIDLASLVAQRLSVPRDNGSNPSGEGGQKKMKYADVINERPLIKIFYLFTLVKRWT